MTLGTHVAFAAVLYLGGATRFGDQPDGIGWALAAVTSLLPDVDLPPAKIGRLFWWLSVPLERRFGHRTLTHGLVALSAVAALTAPLTAIAAPYFWAVVGGYGSHLWIDMLNIRGIDLFWPSPLRVVTPGNRNWRLQVGSKGEMILLSGWLVAVRGAVVVRFWLQPGAAAATLGPGEERREERIPAQLRRFLGITGRQISGEGARKPRDNSQPPHPLLHPFLIDVGVNLGGTEALVAEQGLEVHPLGPGVEPVGGVSVAPLVGRNLLLDAGRLQHPRPAAKLVKLKQFLF